MAGARGVMSGPIDPRVRAMFGRVIAGWARDAMELRRRGLDLPGARRGRSWPVLTGVDAGETGAEWWVDPAAGRMRLSEWSAGRGSSRRAA